MASPGAPVRRPDGPPLKARVLIIGGGIAGLAAARAMLDAGADVAVFERRSLDEMLSGPSGLGVGMNAMRALAMLSGAQPGATLADDVGAAGVPGVRELCMMNSSGGCC